jgi:ribosome-binding factor A
MTLRNERIQEALRAAAAEWLVREANPQSLITVTNTVLSADGRSGKIMITVLPERQENAALSFANRHRRELAAFFKTRVRGAIPPRIEFIIDKGEKNRQRLDELS